MWPKLPMKVPARPRSAQDSPRDATRLELWAALFAPAVQALRAPPLPGLAAASCEPVREGPREAAHVRPVALVRLLPAGGRQL